tara:strand:- start:161 stop:433 length:273 start_codon:yes stop_codon:yes gene_type:complete
MKLKNKKLYDFVNIGSDVTGVVILEGKYNGMVWQYGKVSFDESDDKELKLSFEYEVHENPNNIKPSDILHKFMGDILVEIIKGDLEIDDN